ncbi:hypothetical protein D3C78_1571510 [compost metagenome]
MVETQVDLVRAVGDAGNHLKDPGLLCQAAGLEQIERRLVLLQGCHCTTDRTGKSLTQAPGNLLNDLMAHRVGGREQQPLRPWHIPADELERVAVILKPVAFQAIGNCRAGRPLRVQGTEVNVFPMGLR